MECKTHARIPLGKILNYWQWLTFWRFLKLAVTNWRALKASSFPKRQDSKMTLWSKELRHIHRSLRYIPSRGLKDNYFTLLNSGFPKLTRFSSLHFCRKHFEKHRLNQIELAFRDSINVNNLANVHLNTH